jgi:hypothetical protein
MFETETCVQKGMVQRPKTYRVLPLMDKTYVVQARRRKTAAKGGMPLRRAYWAIPARLLFVAIARWRNDRRKEFRAA